MIKKILRLAIVALVLWFAGGTLYYLAAQQNVQKQLEPVFGPDYSVKIDPFHDWYLQNDSRLTRVTVSSRTGPARSAWTNVSVSGRIFPDTVNLGSTNPFRSLIGDRVDEIGTESRMERARHGIDDSIIEE